MKIAGEGANDKRGYKIAGKGANGKMRCKWLGKMQLTSCGKDVRGETSARKKEKLKRNGKISKERSHKTTLGCSNEEANVTRS